MRKLNSTGNYCYHDGHYWSYDTKLTDSYKGYRFFNNTYYSATTRKHQCYCKANINYDYELTQCSYGNWDIEDSIKLEIEYLKDCLKDRQAQKRNTAKKQADIEELTTKIKEFEQLIDESAKEKEDFFTDFKNTWDNLSEENKEHVRNGLGDNLITSEKQARDITGVMKMMLAFQQLGI